MESPFSSEDPEFMLMMSGFMDEGPTKIAYVEEIVRLADAAENHDLAFNARMELVSAGTFGGAIERAIAAFGWCLAYWDRNPEAVDPNTILWRYKWIVDNLPDFTHISREKMFEMIEDFGRRYEKIGASRYTYHEIRASVAICIGDNSMLQKAIADRSKYKPDSMSDCKACRTNFEVAYWLYLREYKKALSTAKPILDGKESCRILPFAIHCKLIEPLMRIGNSELAKEMHLKSIDQITRDPANWARAYSHILFLTMTGNFAKARKVVETIWPLVDAAYDQNGKYNFYRSAYYLMRRLSESKDAKRLKIRVPKKNELASDVTQRTVDAIRDWFHCQAKTLASQFDARNGNDLYASELKEQEELRKLECELPLDAKKKSQKSGLIKPPAKSRSKKIEDN